MTVSANQVLTSVKLMWTILVAVLTIGIWVGTIQADIGDKAEKIDVATQTQILKSIDDKLGDLKKSVEDLDTRQRAISEDVAELKAKAE